jgi:hypothetical protein
MCEPQLEDFSDSSSTQNDDVIIALFDPLRYKVEDTSGMILEKLVDGIWCQISMKKLD